MLRSGAAEALVSILSNDEDRLVDLAQKFISSFEFNDRISALTGTALLLTDGLLDHGEQIVAFWLLLSEGDLSPIQSHPFFSVFVALYTASVASPNCISPQLHSILLRVLTGIEVESVGEQPVKLIMSDSFDLPVAPHPRVDLGEPNPVSRTSPLLVVEEHVQTKDGLTQDQFLLELLQNESYWDSFSPPFARVVPKVCPIFPGEAAVIDSWTNPPCIFDEGVTVDSRAAATSLLLKATEAKLRQGESDTLIAELKKDSMLADELPIAKITSLIENNVDVAKEVVTAIVGKRPAVLKGLLNLDVTVATADVVKHLIMSKNAPQEFLEAYISNSTKSLLAVRDNQTMARKARLFCKMMGFVVQNGAKLTPKMAIDLNSFCEDPRAKSIKEAQELNSILLNYA